MKEKIGNTKKINIFYIDSRGISSAYGIGSYRKNLMSGLSNKKNLKLYCVRLKYSQKGGVTLREYQNCTHIDISFSFRNSELNLNHGNSHLLIPPSIAKIFVIILIQVTKSSSGIFHINNIWSDIEICKAAKSLGFNVVLTQHVEFYQASNLCNIESRLANENKIFGMLKKMLFFVDSLICLSLKTYEIALSYGVAKSKVYLIFNGIVFPEKLQQNLDKKKIKACFGFSKNDFIILFVGRLEQAKGVEEVVKAFNLFARNKTQARLLVVGDGNFNLMTKHIYRKAAYITFTRFISYQKLRKLYGIANVGILPSYTEQCSYTILEMMRHKIPVIVTNIEGFALFQDNIHVLKATFNKSLSDRWSGISVESLVKNLNTIYSNQTLGDELISNSTNLLKQKLNAEEMAEKTRKCYIETIAKKEK